MSFQSLPPKDVSIKSSGMKDSETSIRHEFVTLSLRREGVIDCCDLSLFQLSLLGKEGGGNLKYAWCHPFYRFFYEVFPKAYSNESPFKYYLSILGGVGSPKFVKTCLYNTWTLPYLNRINWLLKISVFFLTSSLWRTLWCFEYVNFYLIWKISIFVID